MSNRAIDQGLIVRHNVIMANVTTSCVAVLLLSMLHGCTKSKPEKPAGVHYFEALATSRIPISETVIKRLKGGKPARKVVYRSGKIVREFIVTDEEISSATKKHPNLALRAQAFQTAYKMARRIGQAVGTEHRRLRRVFSKSAKSPESYEEFCKFEQEINNVGWRVDFTGRPKRAPETPGEIAEFNRILLGHGELRFFKDPWPDPEPVPVEFSEFESAWNSGWKECFKNDYVEGSSPPPVPLQFKSTDDDWRLGWEYGFYYGFSEELNTK